MGGSARPLAHTVRNVQFAIMSLRRTRLGLDWSAVASDTASILVVDDEASIRETTAALLEDDYKVEQCANGEQALQMLRARPFDVVCTDFRMPGMTGTEVMRAAKKLYAGVAGIIITAYADYPAYQAELQSVSCLVLLKPYEAKQLTDMVARSVRLARMKQLTSAALEAARASGVKR
jgi:two-component system response regulator HupR/HoxA